MLKKDNRFDAYAYRMAQRDLANPANYLEEGSWITLDADGKIVSADGTKLSFLCLTSNRKYRDNVSTQAIHPKATYLLGSFEVTVANNPDVATGDTAFDDSKVYAYLTPLKVVKDAGTALGVLTPLVEGTDTVDKIVAYSVGPADVESKSLRILVR